MTQRTDVRIDLFSDEEGLYDVTVTFTETDEVIIVDPRMVIEHHDTDGVWRQNAADLKRKGTNR